MTTEKKQLDEIYESIQIIEGRVLKITKHLGIVDNLDADIADIENSINNFKYFLTYDLKLDKSTIKNHARAIENFLNFANGQITNETVKTYLQTNTGQNWKNQQIKALRKYIRDYIGLGNWIERFELVNTFTPKPKKLPTIDELATFYVKLPTYTKLIFLLLKDTGLRPNEILSIKRKNIDFDFNSIDASDFHKGKTKFSWVSFFTNQTKKHLFDYIYQNTSYFETENVLLFPVTLRTIEDHFNQASVNCNIELTPKILRLFWANKCRIANIDKDYINAFQGRISKSVLAKHYTDYNIEALKEQYNKLAPLLEFP